MSAFLIDNGAAIAYVAVGVIALVGLGVIQLFRRRRDVNKAREAVRLVALSISAPRPGPIAVEGKYREASGERWLECSGQRVTFDADAEIVRGTRARWRRGVRTYAVRDGDPVIAIGVMSKRADNAWGIVASHGEAGVQLFAAAPRPAPPPLWPWRAAIFLVTCGAIGYGGLYGLGTVVVDTAPRDCSETSMLRLEISSALPMVRDDALAKLGRCRK